MIVGDAVGMDEGSMVIVPASESTASLTVDQQQPQPSKPPSVYEHEDDEPDSTETFVEVPSPTTHHQSAIYEDESALPTGGDWVDLANEGEGQVPGGAGMEARDDTPAPTAPPPGPPAALSTSLATSHFPPVDPPAPAPAPNVATPAIGAVPQEPHTTAAAAISEPAPTHQQEAEKQQLYFTRVLRFGMRDVVTICQNENGPCPLLAICNVLLLRGDLQIHPDRPAIEFSELVNMLTELLLSKEGRYAGQGAHFENSVQTCIELFPEMNRGLDVNVTFQKCQGFEFTRQLQVFDIFGINLYHGWVVDPQDLNATTSIGTLGYNQLVEVVIDSRSRLSDSALAGSTPSELTALAEAEQRGAAIDNWLSANPTQLTFHGLCELHATLQQNELGVFFRNNHFFVILKRKDELLTLVTDQGFSGTSVAWETLQDVSNDSHFLTDEFRNADGGHAAPPPVHTTHSTAAPSDDAAFARQLQAQEDARGIPASTATAQSARAPAVAQAPAPAGDTMPVTAVVQPVMGDAELARMLQAQEDAQAPPAPTQQSPGRQHPHGQPPQPASNRNPSSSVGAAQRPGDADHALAMQLQRQEDERAQMQQPRGRRNPKPPKRDCVCM